MPSNGSVLITGGCGRLGQYVSRDLSSHGHWVKIADLAGTDAATTSTIDVTEPEQLAKIDGEFNAIVHLAAIPSLSKASPQEVFRVNSVASHNVLEFAYSRRIARVVMASSEAVVGMANSYSAMRLHYLPINESHPSLAEDAYGLSKGVQEFLAAGFARRWPQMSIINLRFAWILAEGDYAHTITKLALEPSAGIRKVWSYVDIRDAASAVRMSVESDHVGNDVYFISAQDTLSTEDSAFIAEKYFPGVPFNKNLLPGRKSFLDCEKAQRQLGWIPAHSWVKHIRE